MLFRSPAGGWSLHYSPEGYAYLHKSSSHETLWASSLLGSALYRSSCDTLCVAAPGKDPVFLDELKAKRCQLAYSFQAPGYDAPFVCRVVKAAAPLETSQLHWEVLHLYRQLGLGGYLGGRKAFTDKWANWRAMLVSRCQLPPNHG